MIKPHTLILTLLLFCCTFGISNAQVEKIKAAYLYNFAAMTNYPTSYQSGNFVIAILGNGPIVTEMEAIAKAKKIGSQTIEIKKINSPSEIGHAHMVFVPNDYKSKMADIISKTASTPTIVVAESDGACTKGAVFNLILVEQKLRFEVNESKANAKGVKLAANLVKLGIPVKE
jgi:hypothetical protein